MVRISALRAENVSSNLTGVTNLREWRNRQTRMIEGHVGLSSVQVQILLPAPCRVVITDLIITTRFLLPSEEENSGLSRFRGVVHANAAAHIEGEENVVRHGDFEIAHEPIADRDPLRPVLAGAFRFVHVDMVDQFP